MEFYQNTALLFCSDDLFWINIIHSEVFKQILFFHNC